MASANLWWVYLLAREDDGLYVGISQAVTQRVIQHRKGTGARYTRYAESIEFLGAVPAGGRKDAGRLERKIKHWSPSRKRTFFMRFGGVWERLSGETGSFTPPLSGLKEALREHTVAALALAKAEYAIYDALEEMVPELADLMRLAGMGDQDVIRWLCHPLEQTSESPAEHIAQGHAPWIVSLVVRSVHLP